MSAEGEPLTIVYPLHNNRDCVGGVVGCNESEKNKSIVEKCYNVGAVSAECDKVGDIVGYSGIWTGSGVAMVSQCYDLNKPASQYPIIGRYDGSSRSVYDKNESLTDEQMKEQSSFDGFDFETVWTIGVADDYDYPTLRWEKNTIHTIPEPEKDNKSFSLVPILIGVAVLSVIVLIAVIVVKNKRSRNVSN